MAAPYFASLPPDELSKEIKGRVDSYYQWLLLTGRLARWRVAFNTYYGQRQDFRSYYVTNKGEKGELSFLMSNEYRNLIQHVLTLTTQQRPSVEIGTINNDFKSQAQAILGKQLITYYDQQKNLTDNAKLALEISLIMDSGWVVNDWDLTGGEFIRPNLDGSIITDGDIRSSVRTPLDIAVDVTRDNGLTQDWIIVRDLANKYDLAAQFPEKEEDILACKRDISKDSIYRFGDQNYYGIQFQDSPLIETYTFYHAKTASMPQGRMFRMIDNKTWLFDGPLPFRRRPGVRICPTEMIVSALGYSNLNDLLGLQDVMDGVVSAGVTNMTSCGVNNIWCKPNSNIDYQKLGDGMNFLESETKPEVLELNRLGPDWVPFVNFIIGRLEAYSGMNSVARGNLNGKDLSGSAMALLQSMAIQFNSAMQKSWNSGLEDIYNDTLWLLQDFAQNERTALIAGENHKYMVESFSAAKLDKIQRVFCRQSNPMEATTAGKLTIAQDLLKIPGAIKQPDQYLQVLETGNLEPMLDDPQRETMNIQSENEAMMRGESVPVVYTDKHDKHILCHKAVVDDPETRKNPEILKIALAHIQEHKNQLNIMLTTDPTMAQVLQINIAPPPPPQMALPTGGMVPPPNEAAGGPKQEPAGMPNLPTNPLSGQEWNPDNGGLVVNG